MILCMKNIFDVEVKGKSLVTHIVDTYIQNHRVTGLLYHSKADQHYIPNILNKYESSKKRQGHTNIKSYTQHSSSENRWWWANNA